MVLSCEPLLCVVVCVDVAVAFEKATTTEGLKKRHTIKSTDSGTMSMWSFLTCIRGIKQQYVQAFNKS